MPARTPPARSLPSLSSLQAFEAAARLQSLSAAARERNLSPSALSRAVQAVVHWHGAALFVRNGPRIVLTPAGASLQARLVQPLQALTQLAKAGPGQALAASPPLDLEVHTLASLLSSWLMPHLPSLAAAAPSLRVQWLTGTGIDSLRPHTPAVALRVGRFERRGLRCSALWTDHLVAVAAPRWVRSRGRRPAAWPQRELLQLLSEPWPTRLAGEPLPVAEGPAFSDASLVLQAALAGHGVAWLRHSLVAGALDARRLSLLAEQQGSAPDRTLWLVCREELADLPAVQLFREWLLQLPMPLAAGVRSSGKASSA